MRIKVNFICNRLCQLTVDEVESGVLDADEAKELARELIDAASELLSIESKK